MASTCLPVAAVVPSDRRSYCLSGRPSGAAIQSHATRSTRDGPSKRQQQPLSGPGCQGQSSCRLWARQNSSQGEATTSARLGLVLECDGVVVDIHADAHRPAFNEAFEKMGFDCTNWSPSVYHDLLASGDGTAEGIISAYYNTVGWPWVIPTTERRQFLEKVHAMKRAALDRMVAAGEIKLRSGVVQLIDDALTDGARVAVIAGTGSTPEERIVDAALQALGPFRAQQIRVYTARQETEEPERDGGSSAETSGVGELKLGLEDSMAAAQAKVKRDGARDFIESLKGSAYSSSITVGVDPVLLVASQRAGLIGTSWLAACTATMDVPLRRCAFVSADSTTMKAAQGAGMLSAAVPPRRSARGVFPHADATFDGFGYGGGVTWARLKRMLEARSE
ncbi:hypothetical protein WJX72_009120 [[Myrmecia] bisecta]|uniref:Uncharacterized protein n=1 Tax=[Myrmecia] bisecta TaxID=41462 RepID=A0AAW1QFZ1_9CHLO